MDSALTVVQAQSLRGYDFNQGNLFERMKRYVPAVIPVFMGALRRANNMAMALEARGFGMGATPTSFIEYRTHMRDRIAMAMLGMLGLSYFLLYYSGYAAISPK
jgi:energy-coupling factor transport system permease protein